jgi:hypothetical protein
MIENQSYFYHTQLIKSYILSKRTKIKLCTNLVRPIITYGAETWTVKVTDVHSLRVFERKIIRRIYGHICVDGNWRIRTNKETDELIGHEDRVSFVKSLRIR